jgi:hypothetical protein
MIFAKWVARQDAANGGTPLISKSEPTSPVMGHQGYSVHKKD